MTRRLVLVAAPIPLPIHPRARAATMLETNNGSDPGGWLHIFAGGVLAAAAKWCWDRLVRTQRPARTEHSAAFLLAEVRQLRDSVDGVAGNVQGLEDRLNRLEQQRRPKPATSSD